MTGYACVFVCVCVPLCVYCALCIVHCALCIVRCALCVVHYALCFVLYAWASLECHPRLALPSSSLPPPRAPALSPLPPVVKTRLQQQEGRNNLKYKGAVHCLTTVVKEEVRITFQHVLDERPHTQQSTRASRPGASSSFTFPLHHHHHHHHQSLCVCVCVCARRACLHCGGV
jgi:hypothetical protein